MKIRNIRDRVFDFLCVDSFEHATHIAHLRLDLWDIWRSIWRSIKDKDKKTNANYYGFPESTSWLCRDLFEYGAFWFLMLKEVRKKGRQRREDLELLAECERERHLDSAPRLRLERNKVFDAVSWYFLNRMWCKFKKDHTPENFKGLVLETVRYLKARLRFTYLTLGK